jgi:hypothetical protein
LREGIKGFWVIAKVRDVEDGFRVGEVQARKIGVETGLWRPEVWNASRRTYACACLKEVSESPEAALQCLPLLRSAVPDHL